MRCRQCRQFHVRDARVVHQVAVEHPVAAIGLIGLALGREHGGHAFDGSRAGGRQHDHVRPDREDRRCGGDECRDPPPPRQRARTLPPRAQRGRDDGAARQEDGERHAQYDRLAPFDEQRPGAVDEPAEPHYHGARRGAESRDSTPGGGCPLQGSRHGAGEEDGQRRQQRQDVARLFADGQRVEGQRRRHPDHKPQRALIESPAAPAFPRRRYPEQHERGPGKQAAGDDRQVVPSGPRSVVTIGGESFEVFGKEESIEISGAVLDRHRGVPGRRHEQEERRGESQVERGHPARHAVAPPVQYGEWQHDESGERRTDRSLHEKRAARGQRCQEQPGAALARSRWSCRIVEQGDEGRPGGDRHEEGERQIG